MNVIKNCLPLFKFAPPKGGQFLRSTVLSALLILLSACSSSEKLEEMSAEQLYTRALTQDKEKNYKAAATAFAEVEKQHPYSNWAINAQLMAGYNYYLVKDFDNAQEMFQSFMQLHPRNQYMAYALYMNGLIEYEQIPIIERDQAPASSCLDSFKKLTNLYPDSIYAKSAQLKLDYIYNHLAAKQLEIAFFYQGRLGYISAINRLQSLLQTFPKSIHVPEALYRLYVCYQNLGITNEANLIASQLKKRYPNNSWTQQIATTNNPLITNNSAAAVAVKVVVAPTVTAPTPAVTVAQGATAVPAPAVKVAAPVLNVTTAAATVAQAVINPQTKKIKGHKK